MSDEEDEKEVGQDRYRQIDPLEQLTKLLVAAGGDERVLILQLEVWQKQAHVIIPMKMIEDAQDRANAANFLRRLAGIDSLDETLPVKIASKEVSVEEVLRATIEPDVPIADEGTNPGSVSPIN